jgi:hypothetical protein
MTNGLLHPLGGPEKGLVPSILYPLRAGESLVMVAVIGILFWAFTVLVPEYCLGVWNDANSLGTPSMGMLVILISALPAFLLLPLILIYTLQYFGRVLVSSARGETIPPRLPDRNFEGLLHGLGPWCIWLVLGIGLGPLPFLLYVICGDLTMLNRHVLLGGLILLGFLYGQVSLMLSFLHDHPLAASAPWVIGALLRHGLSFLPTFLKSLVLVGLFGVLLALTLVLREGYFGVYLLIMLACWMLAIDCSIVILRILGLYYFHHKDSLNWNRSEPRWGVAWKL